MSRPLNELLGAFERSIKGEENDALIDTLELLHELSNVEAYVPDFLTLVRQLATIEVQKSKSAEEQRTAAMYLDGGKFDSSHRAFFYLHYRMARKGYGDAGALRVAEHALSLANERCLGEEARALEVAIAALKGEAGSGSIEDAADAMNCEFKAGVRELVTGAAA